MSPGYLFEKNNYNFMYTEKDLEIAWAGGLFEGEGCITDKGGGKNCVLTLRMTDLDSVERFFKAVGVGTITGPYTNGNKGAIRNKPIWCWSVKNKKDCLFVGVLLEKYFGKRRFNKFLEYKENLLKYQNTYMPRHTKKVQVIETEQSFIANIV